jgi:hypothetical protein
LPELLVAADGTPIRDADGWLRRRRPEILEFYTTQVFGRSPAELPAQRFVVTAVDEDALGGKATRKEISIRFSAANDGPRLNLLLFFPNDRSQPVPAFLGANFYGNHAVHPDPGITLSTQWMLPREDRGMVNNRATAASRGTEAGFWQVEKIVARGYALATFYHGDVDLHNRDGVHDGVHSLYYRDDQTAPAPDEWGSISAWSWGLSRVLDYLEREPEIDEKRVAVVGHSMLGKTALWAAAQDQRFAMAIANNSGQGGAALGRRHYGGTTDHMQKKFPDWFCANFARHAHNVNAMPVDQHMLLALIAPRPVYIASAVEDRVADPKGEFLGAKHAEPVYRLFGLTGLGDHGMPPIGKPLGDTVGYHIRSGGHAVTAYDWEQFLRFADRHLTRPD